MNEVNREIAMMEPEIPGAHPTHVYRSLVAVILGSFILRMAAGAMGQNIQFYFNAIHQAALDRVLILRRME